MHQEYDRWCLLWKSIMHSGVLYAARVFGAYLEPAFNNWPDFCCEPFLIVLYEYNVRSYVHKFHLFALLFFCSIISVAFLRCSISKVLHYKFLSFSCLIINWSFVSRCLTRLIKEFERVMKEEEIRNTHDTNKRLNEKKQSMVSFFVLKFTV